jgi:hypothetical protein
LRRSSAATYCVELTKIVLLLDSSIAREGHGILGEKLHKSIFPMGPESFFTDKREPRSGESIKNSARFRFPLADFALPVRSPGFFFFTRDFMSKLRSFG